MMKILKVSLIVFAAGSLLACNGGKNKTNIELAPNMYDQTNVKAQDWDPDRADFSTAMVPPEGTVPRGKPPYKYKSDPIAAGKKLKNPLAQKNDIETLQLGKSNYEIYCMVCHGETGKGDGPVAEKMALRPPALITEKIVNYSDGRIYHIITAGQGVMGSYASQITDAKARWAIVNYMRTLQKKNSAQ